jgi:hypothetical protein
LKWKEDRVCREAGCPLLLASSIKAGLDLDWSDPDDKATAIPTLIGQLNCLERWITSRLPDELNAHLSTNASRHFIRSSDKISSQIPRAVA